MTHTKDLSEIKSMFAYARPKGSATEQAFVDRFLTPLGFERDKHRNLWMQIDMPDGSAPTVLFSSHVDTVDKTEGTKSLTYDAEGMLTLSKKDRAKGFSCLGADDTAGIWLMVHLARANVPGLYVIHHGEESGCIGSRLIADKSPEFLGGIEIALAFDRAGYTDVITHQCSGRTASQGFAWSLARQLGGKFEPSDGGVYTDTNEYSGLIPECSNLSVGYFRQHSQAERQDVPFLIALRDSLLKVDWTTLSVERDPKVYEPISWKDDRFWERDVADMWEEDPMDSQAATQMEALVREYPGIVATVLEAYGLTALDLAEEIEQTTGRPIWGRFA